MIARPLSAPRARESGARPGWRSARNASAVRRARNRRLRYRAIGRVVTWLGALTALVLVYLALVANITRLHYEIGRAERYHTRLVQQSARNEDEIAQLVARERLEQIAARLGMREPQTFAMVLLPEPHRRAVQPPRGVAALFPVMQSIMGITPR
jgi:hypothetical protein